MAASCWVETLVNGFRVNEGLMLAICSQKCVAACAVGRRACVIVVVMLTTVHVLLTCLFVVV